MRFISLYIIQNLDFMSQEKTEKGNSKLKIAMYAILIFSSLMLIFYCGWFWGKPSDDSGDWGSFGSYFGSITGLLAFAGVLYTAWQSEQRANKAEEELARREERDLFFKLLDLYQRQVDSISVGNDKGTISFKELTVKVNQYMISYVALEGYRDNKKNFKGYNQFFNQMVTYFSVSSVDAPHRNADFCLKNGDISDILSYYFYAETYGIDIMKTINIEEISQKMKCVADIIYNEFEHLLGQYYRTIFYLLHLTSGFKQKTEYYKIFRSQLSRYELLLLLYNAVSSQSTDEVKLLYKECDLFNNINADDVLGYVNWNMKGENNVSAFIDRLLDC